MPLKPFKPIKPGDLLLEELEARDWSQVDLAAVLQRPVQVVNEIISGKKAITAETATALAAALGTTPQYWMNLETAYRLDLMPDKSDPSGVKRRSVLYQCAPVADMLKRSWINVKDPKNLDQLEQALCDFYDVASLQNLLDSDMPACAARKTGGGAFTPAQMAWHRMVARQALTIPAAAFKMAKLRKLVRALPQYSVSEEHIRSLPAVLQEVGVKLVLVEAFPRTKIDGIALWVEQSPVVGVSLRLKRIDYFFFTLLHEIVHILEEDVKADSDPCLDVDILDDTATDAIETRANERAKNLLIPPEQYRLFLQRHKARLSRASIEQFADQLRIHPAILIGRLHYEGHLPYSHLRTLLGDVRALFAEAIVG